MCRSVPSLVLLLVVLSSVVLAGEYKQFPIVTPKRLGLTKEYSRQHYGLDSHELKEPKIIVIHYTVTPTLRLSVEMFRPDVLAEHRTEIKGHGQLNIGVHFLVDKNGEVYTLLPTNVMGRHVIGFNHVSLGIENVAADSSQLTDGQLDANVELVKKLVSEHPSIEYLIGHHEYMQRELPHFQLFKELDTTYKPTIKQDPGERFMRVLRDRLQRSGVNLKN